MREREHRGPRGHRGSGAGHLKEHGAKTFRRGRALAFLERMNMKRKALKKQLETPELQTIQPIIVGELKALDMMITEFVQVFELYEFEHKETKVPGEEGGDGGETE